MKSLFYLLGACAIWTGSCFASLDCPGLYSQQQCVGMTVGGEYLYWKPCIDDLEIATVSEATTNEDGSLTTRRGNYRRICPDWQSGYRVTLGLTAPCCYYELRASYVNIQPDGCKNISAEGQIGSPQFNPGFNFFNFRPITSDFFFDTLRTDWDARYQEADILLACEVCCRNCHHFTPYAGVAAIRLQQQLKTRLFFEETDPLPNLRELDVNLRWESDYWGVGLRAGSQYTCQLVPCLSFFASGDATLLVGEPDTKIKGIASGLVLEEGALNTVTSELALHDNKDCLVVPGYHIKAGFVYSSCFCNCNLSLRVGYEFLQWHHLPRQRIYPTVLESAFTNASSASERRLAFHGLFAGGSICF